MAKATQRDTSRSRQNNNLFIPNAVALFLMMIVVPQLLWGSDKTAVQPTSAAVETTSSPMSPFQQESSFSSSYSHHHNHSTGYEDKNTNNPMIHNTKKSSSSSSPPNYVEGGVKAIHKTADKITEIGGIYFAKWLEEQQGAKKQNIINDKSGVGVSASPARVWAFLGKGGRAFDGDAVTIELEFRMVLPNGVEIQEFVSAWGVTANDAAKGCFNNFLHSTFESLYPTFFSNTRPIVDQARASGSLIVEDMSIGGQVFEYTTTGLMIIVPDGTPDDAFGTTSEDIKDALRNINKRFVTHDKLHCHGV